MPTERNTGEETIEERNPRFNRTYAPMGSMSTSSSEGLVAHVSPREWTSTYDALIEASREEPRLREETERTNISREPEIAREEEEHVPLDTTRMEMPRIITPEEYNSCTVSEKEIIANGFKIVEAIKLLQKKVAEQDDYIKLLLKDEEAV